MTDTTKLHTTVSKLWKLQWPHDHSPLWQTTGMRQHTHTRLSLHPPYASWTQPPFSGSQQILEEIVVAFTPSCADQLAIRSCKALLPLARLWKAGPSIKGGSFRKSFPKPFPCLTTSLPPSQPRKPHFFSKQKKKKWDRFLIPPATPIRC